MSAADSLFDPPASSSFATAADWVTGTLFGGVAVSLCVLAIAFVGLMLMTGRLALRDGLRVVIGCFALLGASAIAAGLRDAADGFAAPGTAEPVRAQAFPDPPPLPPAPPDPYAGGPSLQYD